MSTYINKTKKTHSFRTPFLEQGDGKFYPLYIETERFETVPLEIENQYKILVAKETEEKYQFRRSEMKIVLSDDPLEIEVYNDRLIVTFRFSYYVYFQEGKGMASSPNKDEIQWNDKDGYQVIENQATLEMEKTYSVFDLDQQFIEKTILDQSTISTFTTKSIPDGTSGEDTYQSVVSEYKKTFFELPALLEYARENETLGVVFDPLFIQNYIENYKTNFWESGESKLPQGFDSNCPSSESVQSNLEEALNSSVFFIME